MSKLGLTAAAGALCVMLAGCATTSDVYAVKQAESAANNAPSHDRFSDDKPAVRDDDTVKPSFTSYFNASCPVDAPVKAADPKPAPDPRREALVKALKPKDALDLFDKENAKPKSPRSQSCIDKVVTYAVDQCVVETGRQNHFAGKVNEALAISTILAGITADVVALRIKKTDSATSALALATATNSGVSGLKAFVPSISPAGLSTIYDTVTKYTAIAHFDDADWECKEGAVLPTITAAGVTPPPPPKTCRQRVELKYGRLHDAVIALCGAGAY